MNARRSGQWRPVVTGSVATAAVALSGGLLTDLGPWYQHLQEPTWKPPDWAFGAAISGIRAYLHERSASGRAWIVALFAANGALNIIWSLLFFRLKRPDFALTEVGGLWLRYSP